MDATDGALSRIPCAYRWRYRGTKRSPGDQSHQARITIIAQQVRGTQAQQLTALAGACLCGGDGMGHVLGPSCHEIGSRLSVHARGMSAYDPPWGHRCCELWELCLIAQVD